MRIAIVGAGGVGGQLAARLAAAGHAVAVIARGRHLEAIRANGLTLKTPGDDVTVDVEATESAAPLGAADLVILAVKGQDLDAAMEAAAPLMAGEALALPFLNGVEATTRLEARFGAGRALIGIARISAFIEAPGVVRQATPMARYTVGDRDGRQSGEAVSAVRAALSVPGVDVVDHADVRLDLWEKFVMLAAFAGTTAGARCTAGDVLSVPELRALFGDLASEVAAVARAEGVPVPPHAVEAALAMLGRLDPGISASMAYDLKEGKPLELDWLNGAVPRLAARHGLSAPANAVVTALLAPYRDGAPA